MSFYADLAKGQEAEQTVRKTLLKNIYTISANQAQQYSGIDIICQEGDEQLTIEVKFDQIWERSGNVFLELFQGGKLEKKSLLFTCKADILLVVGRTSYAFIWTGLFPQILVAAPHRRWPLKQTNNVSGYNASGFCIPLQDVCKYYGIFAPFSDYAALKAFYSKLTQFELR